jgi:YbbR domain-containing protein
MSGFFKRLVGHNFLLKMLSLLLAAGLWFLIRPDEQPAEVALRAPIVFQHMPSRLEISTENIPDAQIRVRGPERVIRQLQASEVHAEIDLSDVKAEERTFGLTSQQVRHPSDVQVVQVLPSELRLSFDTKLSREVGVHPRLTPIPAEGDVKVETDPPRITITGPSHHVERVDAATTDPIDISHIRGAATFTTNVYVPDPLVQVIKTTSIRVTVTPLKTASDPVH